MSKLRKLKAHYVQWGLWRTAVFLVFRALGRFLGLHLYVVRIRTADTSAPDPLSMTDLELRLISPEELRNFAKDKSLHLGTEFVDDAIARGDHAFGAFDGAALVGYVWRSTTSAPHANALWVRVGRPYSYSYKSFVRPDFRGRHIADALILHADAEMAKRGYPHRAGYVEVTNFASLAMRDRLASRNLGFIGYFRALGKARIFRSKAVEQVGFEFFDPGSS